MSDPVSLASLFDAAEQAAMRGDFAAAARLLGEAARAQEAALGPNHLDLANTLNNLAVAHERSGQLDAAEREYRRAHAIAARTRPADDPLVTTSAQNLREFCEANGRPVDVPPSALTLADDVPEPVTTKTAKRPPQTDVPTVPIEPLPLTLAADPPRPDVAPRAAAPQPDPAPPPKPTPSVAAPAPAKAASVPTTSPAPAPARSAASTAPSAPAEPRRRVSIPVLVALGAVAALVLWLLVGRRPAAPPAETTAAASDTPAVAPSTAPPAAAPSAPRAERSAAAAAPARPAPTAAAPAPASAVSADGVTIGDAQLCTSLSASYRCDAAGSTVRPGRVVFYTRLIAARDTSVVHRWYRGDELRQSIRLGVPARRQGFRTFSRNTVYATPGEWRVELRTRDGRILHTERFTVR